MGGRPIAGGEVGSGLLGTWTQTLCVPVILGLRQGQEPTVSCPLGALILRVWRLPLWLSTTVPWGGRMIAAGACGLGSYVLCRGCGIFWWSGFLTACCCPPIIFSTAFHDKHTLTPTFHLAESVIWENHEYIYNEINVMNLMVQFILFIFDSIVSLPQIITVKWELWELLELCPAIIDMVFKSPSKPSSTTLL